MENLKEEKQWVVVPGEPVMENLLTFVSYVSALPFLILLMPVFIVMIIIYYLFIMN